MTVGGTLDVTGATKITGALDVTGATTLGGDLNVSGATSLNGSLTVAGSSLSFTAHTIDATIITGNHIVSAGGVTLTLDITPPPSAGTFLVIYTTANTYTLNDGASDAPISANTTTVCIYNGALWVAYSSGAPVTFPPPP